MELRTYQQEAIDSVFEYWKAEDGCPLIEMATGTGKSLVMAELMRRLVEGWPDMRILCLAHVAELLSQNFSELVGIWPFAPAGVYSAGLGSRDMHSQIIFAGIQSIYSKAKRLGHVDLVIIDEAHTVGKNSESMYGQFLTALAEINPDIKMLGLTATPYRLDTGRLDEGDTRLFDKIVFRYGIADGIKDGFLCPLVSKATTTTLDVGGVGRRGGDFIPGQLQKAVDKDEITRAAIAEVMSYGHDRKSWLLFGSGVDHARHIAEEVTRNGVRCGLITGKTPSGERARTIEEFRSGKLRAISNANVLSTGFNVPCVDLLAMLRPTESTGLYVQICGRASRNAPGKNNALILDFASNVRRHGPIDCVEPRKPGEGDGTAPVKECPNCHSLIHLSVMVCGDCGYEFPKEDKPKHEAKAAALPILSTSAPEWLPVSSRKLYYHDKIGGTPSVRAEFLCNFVNYKHWICPGHQGYAKTKSDKWWRQHGGETPAPASVDDFLARVGELRDTNQIQVRPSGKYWEIVGFKVDPVAKQQAAGIADYKPDVKHLYSNLDDEIPF